MRAHKTPGGHRRIKADELATFVVQHELPIPPELAGLVATRVLWVDTDKAARNRLARKLKGPGVVLELAATAVEALLSAGSFKPNVVVIDGRVDDVERDAIAGALITHPATKGVRVVYVDGSEIPSERVAGEAAGVSLFLLREDDPRLVFKT